MSLQKIQAELKAPKSQYNSFGKYYFRNLEDIFEAVKPLLSKYEMHLIVSDNMIEVGNRVYVCASATLYEKDGNVVASNQAFAREAEDRKGMDDSQITGATSSYARKYALNGLFCIDDTKDADATNKHGKDEKPPVTSAKYENEMDKHGTVKSLGAYWTKNVKKMQSELSEVEFDKAVNYKDQLKETLENVENKSTGEDAPLFTGDK